MSLFKRRRVKWEPDGEWRWIVRMNSESLTVERISLDGCYEVYLGKVGIVLQAGNFQHAQYQAVRWARQRIRRMAREWGILR